MKHKPLPMILKAHDLISVYERIRPFPELKPAQEELVRLINGEIVSFQPNQEPNQ